MGGAEGGAAEPFETYIPPKGLPFESTGSFEGDKERYQENRQGYTLKIAALFREGTMDSYNRAKAEEEKYKKLDKFFGIED